MATVNKNATQGLVELFSLWDNHANLIANLSGVVLMQKVEAIPLCNTKKYTVGFIFKPDCKSVALIQKTHPPSQAGRLNGVGGLVEQNESPSVCMAREAHEESNFVSKVKDWTYLGKIIPTSKPKIIFFYAAVAFDPNVIRTRTKEKVNWYSARSLPDHALDNLQSLVLLAKLELQNPGSQGTFIIQGGTSNDL